MCDTFIALSNSTLNGNVLLAKNSDREPNEAQAILQVKRRINAEANVRCTFIEIPQVPETYACILSKPFQMWGAEMGVNEWGVAIANEAVFTKVKFNKHQVGLTGMDLLRLALERSRTAKQAVDCIIHLLETHGQDACGGYQQKNFYYHNSFIICDTQDAWVLETAGKAWALEKVKTIRSISNALSIAEADRISKEAQNFAQQKGWWKEGKPFHFNRVYSDWLYTRIGRAAIRQTCSNNLIKLSAPNISADHCMQVLQTHNLPEPHFKPSKTNTASLCMHATSLFNPSTTTGSMVAELRSDKAHTLWLTGTSMPCLSVYLPFFFNTELFDHISQPSDKADNSLWWRAEKLHRWICQDYQKRKALIDPQRKQLQASFIERERALFNTKPSDEALNTFSQDCYLQMNQLLHQWCSYVDT